MVAEVGRQPLHLLDHDAVGTSNCVNAGAARRFDSVSASVVQSSRDRVVEPSTQPIKRAARASPSESARNFRLGLLGLDGMRPWQDVLPDSSAAARGWPEWAEVVA